MFEGEARYRGSFGGRGSGKTRSFALMTAVWGYKFGSSGISGQILCGREHLNSLEESSLEEVKSAIRSVPWLENYYEIGERYIRSKDGRITYVFAGLRHNLDEVYLSCTLTCRWRCYPCHGTYHIALAQSSVIPMDLYRIAVNTHERPFELCSFFI